MKKKCFFLPHIAAEHYLLLRPAGPLGGNCDKTFITFYLDVCAPQGHSVVILIRNSLLFIRIFCPAGPLGENFDKKFTTFYLNFSAPQGRSVRILIRNILSFICIFCPAGPLSGNFDKKYTTFYLDFLPCSAALQEFS